MLVKVEITTVCNIITERYSIRNFNNCSDKLTLEELNTNFLFPKKDDITPAILAIIFEIIKLSC
jgi:hypothetical protein